MVTAHNAARPTEAAPRKRRLFFSMVPLLRRDISGGGAPVILAFRRTFVHLMIRRFLETGPAAVRNTLVAILVDTKKDDIQFREFKVIKTDYMDSFEGTVFLRGQNEKTLNAFFYGFRFDIDKTYQVKFSSLDSPLEWDVIFSGNPNNRQSLESDGGHWSYLAYGKIVSICPVMADFGDIVLEIGDWTHDEKTIGEYIYWKIGRLDIMEVQNCN